MEVGFCRDLSCVEKKEEKTVKYAPLVAALSKHWGKVELVCIPIGHAGSTLQSTITEMANALSAVRPPIATIRRRAGHAKPETDAKALKHDKALIKSLLDSLCSLAQDRLLSIVANRRKLVAALPHQQNNNNNPPAHKTASLRPPPRPGE